MTGPIRIRNSEIAKFMRCKRSWYLEYGRGLRRRPVQKLFPGTYDTGTAVHVGLAAYYRGEDPTYAIDAFERETEASLHPQADTGQWSKSFEMARRMVGAYTVWVAENGIDVGETTLTIEQELEAEIMPGVVLYGTPDRVKKNRAGHILVEDWKTGVIDRPFQMENDWQLLNYYLLVSSNYDDPMVGVQHRRLKRSMHTAAAKSPQFAVHTASVRPSRLDVHRRHVENVVTELLQYRQKVAAGADPVFTYTPHRMPNNCNWDCAFADVCAQMDDGDDWEYTVEELYTNET